MRMCEIITYTSILFFIEAVQKIIFKKVSLSSLRPISFAKVLLLEVEKKY